MKRVGEKRSKETKREKLQGLETWGREGKVRMRAEDEGPELMGKR